MKKALEIRLPEEEMLRIWGGKSLSQMLSFLSPVIDKVADPVEKEALRAKVESAVRHLWP